MQMFNASILWGQLISLQIDLPEIIQKKIEFRLLLQSCDSENISLQYLQVCTRIKKIVPINLITAIF